MPSPILTEDQYEAAIAEEYNGAGYIAFVSNTVIFQAEVASVPTGNDFAQISFTNVTTGAYTDLREGMTLLLSTELTNYKSGYFRGRVRKPPTSSIVYVNEMSEALTVGDIITVINTYEPREKARRLTFVDWDKPFEDLAPIVKNMQSAYAKITTGSSATFSFSPIGQAMAEGDSVADYLWEFDGTSTIYNSGAEDEREIEVELSSDTEWGRLTITTANGISSWFVFSIHIGHPSTDSRFLLCHEPASIDAGLETGYNASASVFGNFTDVMDRTRCVVIVDETYGTEPDPELGNIRFVGYLTKDSSTTRGDAQYGVVQSTQIEMQGFLAVAAEIAMVPIGVRHVNPPAAWDDMDTPTTQRIMGHILTQHSTLANLCAIDFGTLDNTWFASNFDITDTSLMDAVRTVGSEINASLVSDAAGQLVFEIHGSFLPEDDRDALPFVVPEDLNAGNVFEFSLERVHTPRVGKVEMGARVFFEDGTPSIGYTAMAPAVAYGQGQERVTIPNALLPAGGDATDAGQRAAFWFSFKNNTITLNGQLTDGFGWISPSTAQWWPFSITATDTTRGIVITSDTRWLLVSVRTVINADGTQDVNAQWIPETMAGRSLILVAKSPSVIETELPIVPIRGAIGAYPPRASINYDTVDPANQIRRDPFSSWQTTPWPASDAAAAANKQPKAGCRTFGVNFRKEANTTSGFTTLNGAPYKIKVSGAGRIADNLWTHSIDFKLTDGGLAPNGGVWMNAYGNWLLGVGWQSTAASPDGLLRQAINLAISLPTATYTFARPTFDYTRGTWDLPGSEAIGMFLDLTTPTLFFSASDPLSDGTDKTITGGGLFEADGFSLFITASTGHSDGSATLTRLDLAGLGTNPFTGEPGLETWGDAFHMWNRDEDGNPINVQLNPGGLYFAATNVDVGAPATATPPPFNENSIYDFTWEGTGNVLWARFKDSDYTDNQSALLYIEACGSGAGQ